MQAIGLGCWQASLGDGICPTNTHDAPAFIPYTSGTTGRSKGALATHANVVHSCPIGRATFAIKDRIKDTIERGGEKVYGAEVPRSPNGKVMKVLLGSAA